MTFSSLLLPYLPLLITLEGKLEMLHHHSGQVSDYVGARGSSLVEHLNNVPCHIYDIVDLGVHHGATVVLLVGELRSGCGL